MGTTEPLIDVGIPPSDAIRKKLAVNLTEADILRSLLKVAVRREREAERLAKLLGTNGANGRMGVAV
jgi:hypothetical protein